MTERLNGLGERLPRREAREKIAGRAQYLDDIVRPAMLHAAYLLSTIPHGRIVSCDTTEAAAMPGVHAVLTGDDFPGSAAG